MARTRARLAALTVLAVVGAFLSPLASSTAIAAATVAPQVMAPPPSTDLGISQVGRVAVDNTNRHVFVTGDSSVVVTDFNGSVVKTITGEDSADGIAVDEAANTLYVALHTADAIAEISLTTLTETGRISLGKDAYGTICPRDVIEDGDNHLWVTGGCDSGQLIYEVDLADDSVTSFQSMYFASTIVRIPQHPHELLMADTYTTGHLLHLVDTSTSPATVVATAEIPDFRNDIAASGDGTEVYAGGDKFKEADLSSDGTFTPVFRSSSLVSLGSVFANGSTYSDSSTVNLAVFDATFGTPLRSYVLNGGVALHGLAFATDGTLFIVTLPNGTPHLSAIPQADKLGSTVTVHAPHKALPGATVHVTGTLTPAPGKSETASVSRTIRSVTSGLADITVAADGTFAFDDTVSGTGRATYAVTYPGDDSLGTSIGTDSTVFGVPYDFNGDGYADLVVGSPFEDVGTASNTGSITVLYSGPGGVTSTGAVAFDQNTAGVPGVNESGDQFGWSQYSGDFNGDGFADLAVGANAEDVASTSNAGTITILYGSAGGLTTAGSTTFDPSVQGGGYFGESMAVGDFNGDGIDDLVTSAHETVLEFNGTLSGLSTAVTAAYTQGTTGVPGTYYSDELFGLSLSAGDINGDGKDDLAVGTPYDKDDHGYAAGSATIFYGASTGLTTTGAERFTKDTNGVPGAEHTYVNGQDDPDSFGFQVDLGDFNGDGKADLAVSAPGSPVTTSDGIKHEDAGTVTVLYSDGTKIGTTSAKEVNQATSGMPGGPGKGDEAGFTMAVGDANHDGKADLVEYSPGDHLVTAIMGASTGLSFGTAKAWTQNTTGIPGTDEAGDYWGYSLRFEYFKGPGPQGLAVGAGGENSGQGAVTLIYSTSSGLTATGSVAFTQNSTGVPGTSENGDWFGSFFSF